MCLRWCEARLSFVKKRIQKANVTAHKHTHYISLMNLRMQKHFCCYGISTNCDRHSWDTVVLANNVLCIESVRWHNACIHWNDIIQVCIVSMTSTIFLAIFVAIWMFFRHLLAFTSSNLHIDDIKCELIKNTFTFLMPDRMKVSKRTHFGWLCVRCRLKAAFFFLRQCRCCCHRQRRPWWRWRLYGHS